MSRFALRTTCRGLFDNEPEIRTRKTFSGKARLLDLFCCAGGAGMGYSKAGFEVVGVDLKPQPNYPFQFIQADALTLDRDFIGSFDAVHASPPCQSYSDLAKRNRNADQWPRLIEPVREMLVGSGLPYIIENVEGAPMIDAVVLCGTMFPKLRVLRHRLFEANFPIVAPPHRKHPLVHTFDRRKSHFGKTDEWRDFVGVFGGGNCTIAAARDAMGIDWMTKNEINESIPPAYTELIGSQLLRHMSYEGPLEAEQRIAYAQLKGTNQAIPAFPHRAGRYIDRTARRGRCERVGAAVAGTARRGGLADPQPQ